MRTEDFMDLLNEVDDKFIQELYEETEFSKPAKKTSRTSIVWTRWAGIAAAFALIILGSVLLMKYKSAPTVIVPDSTQHLNDSMDSSVVYTDDGSPAVILDINPSIEIKIDEETEQVSQLIPLNKDAEELLTNVLMTTNNVSDCVDLLLTELSGESYITPTSNSILVTVVNGNEQQAQHLSDLMINGLQKSAKEEQMSLSIVTQYLPDPEQYGELAMQNEISVGKAALISSITENLNATDYDYTRLADMNIQALNQVADYVSASINRIGNVAGDINEQQLDVIGIASMEIEAALQLAQDISETYAQLVEANPSANDPVNYNRWITMEQNANSEWSLVIRDPSSGQSQAVFSFSGGSSSADRVPNIFEHAWHGFFDFWSSFLPF